MSDMMRTEQPITSKTSSRCDECPSCYDCGKLFSALTVLNSMPSNGSTGEQEAKLQEILLLLREVGFSYPTSDTLCDLAHHPQEVRALTNRTIQLIHQILARFHTHRPASVNAPGP